MKVTRVFPRIKMTEWNEQSFIDFIKGENETLNLFGPYVENQKDRLNLETKIEQISDKVISRIDEGLVADFNYSDESLETIENIIDDAFKNSEEEISNDLIEDLVMDLGSYLGLTIINNLGGEWRFRSDFMHSSIYFKTIDAECFPFHRVARRLVQGRSESLEDFYLSLIEVLGAAD
jgi:hypothetical protein